MRLGSPIQSKNYGYVFMTTDSVEANSPNVNTIEVGITDPNFNVMRKNSTKKSTSIVLVVGALLVGTIFPVVTWYIFSK